jgi:UMF1 family MFS transporter
LFGAIADYGGHHKRWIFIFTYLTILSSALLWFAYPNTHSVYLTLSCLVFGTVGLEIALVFYNAFLPYLAPKNYVGRISGWGWGCGYLGGILALSIALFVFVKPKIGWFDSTTAAQIRICGPFVGVWIALFSWPFFCLVPGIPSVAHSLRIAIRKGCSELFYTLKKLPQEWNIFLYLFSHMVYADGLNTLFAFGGIYAAGTYGLSFEEVLLFGITMNMTAGIGAVSLAWMDDCFGSKLTVIVSLIFLVALGIPILFLHDKYLFWVVALLLAIFVGPVQSASRSMMVKLIAHKETATEFFGLYALSGKVTAFIGPWLLGWMTLSFGSQRAGMASILVFFILGAILLLPVKVLK